MSGNLYKGDVRLGYHPDQDSINVEAAPMRNIFGKLTGLFSPKPMIQDSISMTGRMHVKLWNPTTGEIKQEFEQKNLVVTTGKVQLAKQLNAESINAMTHVAIGTSSQSPAAGDTGLVGTEAARVAATKTRSTNVVTFAASYAPGTGTNATLNEAGIFDGSSGTVMLARVITSSTINKTASDQLDISWAITVG